MAPLLLPGEQNAILTASSDTALHADIYISSEEKLLTSQVTQEVSQQSAVSYRTCLTEFNCRSQNRIRAPGSSIAFLLLLASPLVATMTPRLPIIAFRDVQAALYTSSALRPDRSVDHFKLSCFYRKRAGVGCSCTYLIFGHHICCSCLFQLHRRL